MLTGYGRWRWTPDTGPARELMNYIFWLIGVIVVIAAVLSFLGLR
jgi:hypothetical protein